MIGNRHSKFHLSGRQAGKQGFTLVELLVSVTIFVLAVATAIGLLTAALRSQRRSIAIQNIQDNGRYLVSFMAKEIRMSEVSVSDGETTTLNIVHPVNGSIAYSFSGTQILRNGEPINSDEVTVEGRFYVDGKTGGDNEQSRVTIVMKIETTGAKTEEQSEINLQTTLCQRKLD